MEMEIILMYSRPPVTTLNNARANTIVNDFELEGQQIKSSEMSVRWEHNERKEERNDDLTIKEHLIGVGNMVSVGVFKQMCYFGSRRVQQSHGLKQEIFWL